MAIALDKSHFLITGLPRTRTTWLTILMNCIGVDTRHERDLYFNSMQELTTWVKEGTNEDPHGFVDGFASIVYPKFALNLFKDNPIVFIKRNIDSVLKSWTTWQSKDISNEWKHKCMVNYLTFIENLPQTALVISYSDLDKFEVVNKIVQYTTNRTLSKELFNLLNLSQIELNRNKCTEFSSTQNKKYIYEIEC